MCSMYWTLIAKEACPSCGEVQEIQMQTHYMGEPGSCLRTYVIGEPVEELQKIEKARLGAFEEGCPDDFVDSCNSCNAWIKFGAEIKDGMVVRIWPYAFE